jgi:DNA-binding NarL/FixJ family response regulator
MAMHATFRDHLVASEPDWQLDTHTHGAPAWPALRANPPQFVLLAQTLPDVCGMEYLHRCKSQLPELPVVILTTQGGAKTPLDALLAGAHGYWVKRADAVDFGAAIAQSFGGRDYFVRGSRALVATGHCRAAAAYAGAVGSVSAREEEILSTPVLPTHQQRHCACFGIGFGHRARALGPHFQEAGRSRPPSGNKEIFPTPLKG